MYNLIRDHFYFNNRENLAILETKFKSPYWNLFNYYFSLTKNLYLFSSAPVLNQLHTNLQTPKFLRRCFS